MQHFVTLNQQPSITRKQELRPYQLEACAAIINSTRGQCILPTGTGKSTIEAAVIEHLLQVDSGFNVYVILTPRILLTNQLMETVVDDLLSANIRNIKTLTVHSASSVTFYDEDDVSIEEKAIYDSLGNKATTNPMDISNAVIKAYRDNTPILVCCTYDSVLQLIKGLEYASNELGVTITVKQSLCDEAHYITERDNNENICKLNNISDRIHYLTATRKLTTSAAGLGMNNINLFGDVLYMKEPRYMIDNGYMVEPCIHHAITGKDTSYGKIVMDSYDEHSKHVNGNPKLIVHCNGTKTVEEIRNNKHLIEYAKNNNIAIYSITSANGAYRNEHFYINRNDFLSDLRNDQGRAIVLHIAILTEGIDIPDMSGGLFLRNMGTARFLQAVGRTTRMLPCDYGVELKNRIKKYAYVICVDRQNDSEANDSYTNLIEMTRKMRLAGFEAKEVIWSEIDIGTDPKDDGLTDNNLRSRRAKAFKTALDKTDHEIEDMTLHEQFTFDTTNITDTAAQELADRINKLILV